MFYNLIVIFVNDKVQSVSLPLMAIIGRVSFKSALMQDHYKNDT